MKTVSYLALVTANLRSHFLGIHGPATSKRAVYLPDE